MVSCCELTYVSITDWVDVGSSEIPLDLMTRVAIDHIRGMGRTLRMFMDGFAQKMAPDVSFTLTTDIYQLTNLVQEIILHALHEHGQLQTQDLESYIKDDIERENVKVTEVAKKVKQAYREIVSFSASELNFQLISAVGYRSSYRG
jgi:transcriptional activator SPT7